MTVDTTLYIKSLNVNNMKQLKILRQIIYCSLSVLILTLSSCKNDSDILEDTSTHIEGLYINEIYPSSPGWIELYNSTDNSIDVSGFIIQSNKGPTEEYTFPQGTSIGKNSFLVINEEVNFKFTINAEDGDKISLADKSRVELDEVSMPTIDGEKSYARNEDGANVWGISDNPTKGISNSSTPEPEPEPTDLKLYINEVYSSNPDWIELYNAYDEEIDISGFILQDDKGEAEESVIRDEIKIPAKSYLVLEENTDFVFGLSSSNGDQLILLDKNRVQIDMVIIPVMVSGKSYGRSTDGGDEWIVFEKPTKGLDNTTEIEDDPAIPVDPEAFVSLILNEICGEQKYVEIYNKGNEEISLYGIKLERNEGSSKYTFITTDVIPAGAYRLILFNGYETTLEENEAYVGWTVDSGISDQQTLSVQLITTDGSIINSFQRGVEPWGTTGAQRERAFSYSRQDDGTWGYAEYTPGKINAVTEKEIVDPGYTTE